MAKGNKEVAPTQKSETPSVAPNALFLEQFGASFESLEKEELQELASEYKGEWTEGEIFDCIVYGIGEFTVTENGEKKTKECIQVYDKQAQNFIIGATVAVNCAKKVGIFPFPCRIICKGKKTGANGKYFDLSVNVPLSFLAANKAAKN